MQVPSTRQRGRSLNQTTAPVAQAVELDLFSDDVSTASLASDDIELPDWREVNRSERAARKAERALAASRNAGEGIHRRALEDVSRRHPGNALKQLSAFLGQIDMPAGSGRKRLIGDTTATHHGNVLHQSIKDLHAARLPIQNLRDFGQKHILALIRLWMSEGRAIGTIDWRTSIWRRFLTVTGKPTAIPKGRTWDSLLRQHGLGAATVSRATIPELSKGWRDLGIQPEPIVEAIRQEAAVVGACLDMMLAFGLRVNESVQLEPADSDEGVHLSIHRGTKGGKHRKVKFSTDAVKNEWQRRLLANAKTLAGTHPKRQLAIPGLSLKQMKERLRYLVRKHGASKSGLGITPHGLRHQFGTDLFRDLTGMPAPVLGQLPAAEYDRNIDAVREAYLEIARQMGHERPSISGAYISTPAHVGKLELKRLKTWLSQLGDGAGMAFRAAGACEAWIIGACAEGLPLREGGIMQLAVRFAEVDATLSVRLGELRKAVELNLGVTANVTCWLEPHRPGDGAEISF